jgi:hypothetical protein
MRAPTDRSAKGKGVIEITMEDKKSPIISKVRALKLQIIDLHHIPACLCRRSFPFPCPNELERRALLPHISVVITSFHANITHNSTPSTTIISTLLVLTSTHCSPALLLLSVLPSRDGFFRWGYVPVVAVCGGGQCELFLHVASVFNPLFGCFGAVFAFVLLSLMCSWCRPPRRVIAPFDGSTC